MFNLFLKRYQLKVKLASLKFPKFNADPSKRNQCNILVFRVRLVKGGGD